ncbi:camk family protein kinase [Anaeramoeba flamelloides]|uniref:non-specific serine/threonine protein kinase n=1 Tax=Anaeramoeba flamelloides TaxID=1746091 RepID=A0ABQ8Y0B4_9EUKA|nr:camk family protein kinase [Anaeramoeba flamelloides]
MEFANGGDLREKIERQKDLGQYFSEGEILEMFIQICLALQHIHSKKIIHRDLKLANIFLTKSGQIKVGDFGISKLLQNTLEKAKTVCGTPYYLSPEIINQKPYSYKTDVWSIGIILYELCTLKRAFNGTNIPQLAFKISSSKVDPIPGFYSKHLQRLVYELLERDESKRPTINQILQKSFVRNKIRKMRYEYKRKIQNYYSKKKSKNQNLNRLHKPLLDLERKKKLNHRKDSAKKVKIGGSKKSHKSKKNNYRNIKESNNKLKPRLKMSPKMKQNNFKQYKSKLRNKKLSSGKKRNHSKQIHSNNHHKVDRRNPKRLFNSPKNRIDTSDTPTWYLSSNEFKEKEEKEKEKEKERERGKEKENKKIMISNYDKNKYKIKNKNKNKNIINNHTNMNKYEPNKDENEKMDLLEKLSSNEKKLSNININSDNSLIIKPINNEQSKEIFNRIEKHKKKKKEKKTKNNNQDDDFGTSKFGKDFDKILDNALTITNQPEKDQNKIREELQHYQLFSPSLGIPNLSSEDTITTKIEKLREYIEQLVGEECSVKAYLCIKQLNDQDNDEDFAFKISNILQDKIEFLYLIGHLVSCEDFVSSQMNRKNL